MSDSELVKIINNYSPEKEFLVLVVREPSRIQTPDYLLCSVGVTLHFCLLTEPYKTTTSLQIQLQATFTERRLR
jgi:hypothetical protein